MTTETKEEPTIATQSTAAASPPKDKTAPTHTQVKDQDNGLALPSFGKGASKAYLARDGQSVEIRRSGKLVSRLKTPEEVAQFAIDKKLSPTDAKALGEVLTPPARAGSRASPLEPLNAVEQAGKIRSNLELADPEVFAWVERQRRNRLNSPEYLAGQERVKPDANRAVIMPPDLEAKYLKVGNAYLFRSGSNQQAFVDRGARLETKLSTPSAVNDLVKIAEARGWTELRVTGTTEFKREVWMQASERGIQVDGYKPTAVDKALMQERLSRTPANSIEAKSTTFRESPPAEGASKDPSLINSYGIVQAATAFAAEKIDDPKSRTDFIDTVRDDLSKRIDQEKKIPGLKVRDPEGQILEHGKAPYNFDKLEKESYFVKLATPHREPRIVWGKGLEEAIAQSGAQVGDKVRLDLVNSKPVEVTANVRDKDGQVVGKTTVDSQRNKWTVSVRQREVEQERTR